MKLIVGLGNPGLKYKNTRHNIGFLAVDNFKRLYKDKLNREVVLLKPKSFMNRSGVVLKRAIEKFGVSLSQDVLVVCDDINLELGIIRFRAKGSAGGHRGLQSIIDELGVEDFDRLRIGIGAAKGMVLKDYVLSEFGPDEKKVLRKVLDRICEAIAVWIEEGIEIAMSKYNERNPKS